MASKRQHSPRYLAKRADLTSRPLRWKARDGVDQVVVIPILSEEKTFSATLESLAANDGDSLSRTLILGVVNNAPPSHCAPETLAENGRTLGYTLPLRFARIEIR